MRFFLAIIKTSNVVLLFYTTLEVYTKFGMASTQLDDFAAPMVNTYSLETTVAEMLDAILSLMEFSSRMKDYYDLYYLANKFDFDGAILTEALKKTSI